MNITGIRLRAGDRIWNKPNTITFPLREVAEDYPYILVASTGLGPPEELTPAVQDFHMFGAQAGTANVHMVSERREVVFRVGLNPNFGSEQSYSSLRDEIYKLIASDSQGYVTLELLNGNTLVAYAVGRFGRVEATHFVEQPELQVTIRFEKENVVFRGDETIVAPSFGNSPLALVYEGTAPTPMKIKSSFYGNRNDWYIRDIIGPNWTFMVIYDFLTGDELEVDTDSTNFHVLLTRNSVTTEITQHVVAGEAFVPLIYPGVNNYDWPNSGYAIDEISYLNRYWGI